MLLWMKLAAQKLRRMSIQNSFKFCELYENPGHNLNAVERIKQHPKKDNPDNFNLMKYFK